MELLAYSQDALLAANEANKIAIRNLAYQTAATNAANQFNWYNAYVLNQQSQLGYVGGD